MHRRHLAVLLVGALACASGDRAPSEEAASTPRLPEKIMPAEVIPQGPDQVATPDGLVQLDVPGLRGRIFVRPPRPYLQRYHQLLLYPPELAYRRGVKPFPARTEESLRAYFDRRVREELAGKPGWGLANAPGPDVIAAAIAVHDLAINTEKNETNSSVTRVSTSPPCVLRLELFDSLSQQPLLRFLQRRRLQAGTFGGGNVDVSRLRREFDDFANEIGEHLRTYYAAAQEVQRREEAAGKN